MRESQAVAQLAVYECRSAVIVDQAEVDVLCVSETADIPAYGPAVVTALEGAALERRLSFVEAQHLIDREGKSHE